MNDKGNTKAATRTGLKALLASFCFSMLITIPLNAQETATRSGWILFDDSVATELEIRDSQLERLQTIDRRYQGDYERLGADPRSDPNYLTLTERRNAEIQTVLDSDQYDQWMRLNDYDYNNSQRRAEPGPQSSEMDRRNPQGNQFHRDSRSTVGEGRTPKSGRAGSDGVGGSGSGTQVAPR